MVLNQQNKIQSVRNGFTLIEVMVVVVIFGVLSALAAPTFQQSYDRFKFHGGERLVSASLKKARSFAVTSKAPVGVYFNTATREVTIFKNTTNPSVSSFESTDSVYTTDTLADGFSYVFADMTNNAVVFQPNGSAIFTGSGNVFLVGETTNLLAYFNISILASTGRVASASHFYNW